MATLGLSLELEIRCSDLILEKQFEQLRNLNDNSEYFNYSDHLIKEYLNEGKGRIIKNQIALVKAYIPNYYRSCEGYLRPTIRKCSDAYNPDLIDEQEFDSCARPYIISFQNLEQEFMRETAIAGEIVDFDNFKLYRSDASKKRMAH